jgi:hypothetical protein
MAEQWPDHPAVAVAGDEQWPDHPAAAQSFYPDTEVRAAPLTFSGSPPSMAPGILAGAASLPVGAAQLLAHGAAALAP